MTPAGGGIDVAVSGDVEVRLESLDTDGLDVASAYLVAKLQEILSVQAPREWTGTHWRALTPAIPGDPPRRLSGAMQAAVQRFWDSPNVVRVGVWGLPYPRRHEFGKHPFFGVVLRREAGMLARMLSGV